MELNILYMLKSVLEQKAALAQYASDHDIPQLTAQHWNIVEKALILLGPCEELTELSQDDSSISMVIPAYNVLRRTLISIDSGGIGSIKEALLESLDSRFVSYCNSLPYCMATILDPLYKATFLNKRYDS